MRFDIFTTLPSMFAGPLSESILKRAAQKGLLDIRLHDLRNWTADKHRTTDDYPYGGGPGMVMKPEPIFAAIEDVLGNSPDVPVILMDPGGERFSQRIAEELASLDRIAIVCGHYEGVDERVRERLITREISIGDYVLSGGEIASAVVVDAVSRLVPGVIDSQSRLEESHTSGLLEYPQYTRPATFRDMAVPEVLLSGNHAEIAKWRLRKAVERTRRQRPEMLERWIQSHGSDLEE